MKRRWISSIAFGVLLLALCTHPSVARLSEGNFIPFSQAVNQMADQQLQLHRIEKGDTLCKLAREYNVDMQDLMEVNNLQEDSILNIGQTLKIPRSQDTVHIVAPGETIDKVGEIYGLSRQELAYANPDINLDCLEVGQCVSVPSSEAAGVDKINSEPSRGLSAANLSWPITGAITSSFGKRKAGFHHGVDIAAKVGDPICAAAAGTVSFAGWKAVYGKTVIIDHPDGKQTLYAHTQNILVKKGDQIDRGQKIATVGLTGNTTGPHVHFEVRIAKATCNPLNYLRY